MKTLESRIRDKRDSEWSLWEVVEKVTFTKDGIWVNGVFFDPTKWEVEFRNA